MQYGVVNEIGNVMEARITLTILGNDAGNEDIPFLIDTGFGGALALPIHIIRRLDLPPADSRYTEVTLADGSTETVGRYVARLLWHGRRREVNLLNLDGEPLVGMELLRGSNISVDAAPGGVVAIAELAAAS